MLTKVCTKCGVEKTVDCFAKKKTGKYGVKPVCKGCNNLYYSNNKEVILKKMRMNYLSNKEVRLARQRNYYHQNKDVVNAYRQENKKRLAEYRKSYQQSNKSYFNTQTASRRALKIKATPSWIDQEAVDGMYDLASLFNDVGLDVHVDHIVPLNSDKVCGLHCEANLQLLLASDNISKGNRWWPDMW